MKGWRAAEVTRRRELGRENKVRDLANHVQRQHTLFELIWFKLVQIKNNLLLQFCNEQEP